MWLELSKIGLQRPFGFSGAREVILAMNNGVFDRRDPMNRAQFQPPSPNANLPVSTGSKASQKKAIRGSQPRKRGYGEESRCLPNMKRRHPHPQNPTPT